MRERTAQLLLLCGGLIVSCLLAEAWFYLLNRAAATYPVVVYATDKPGTELWCYDDKFQGKADWDLRLGHPYRALTYRSNMDFDSTLVALDPLAVPMAIKVALNFDEFRARPLPLIKAGAAGEGLTLVVGDSFCFGQGVRREDRFSELIEARLRRDGGTQTLANLCKCGADLIRIFLTIRKSVEYFGAVDRVLYAYTPNDAIQDEATGAMNAAIHDLMHYREAFFRRSYGSVLDAIPSQTLRFFAARKLRDKISEETLAWYRRTYSDENQGWGHTRTLLRDIADFCRARDIKFTVVQFPLYYRLDDYPLAYIHQQLGEFATSEGIEWIDLLPLFAGKDERDYWVHPRDFHPNTRAHHEVADFLYSAVKW